MLKLYDTYDPENDELFSRASRTFGVYKLDFAEGHVTRTWRYGLVQQDRAEFEGVGESLWTATTPEAALWLLANMPDRAQVIEEAP